MRVKTFAQVINCLYDFIPKGTLLTFPGSMGLDRTKYFLQLLGSPQNKLKVVHIAGTSGKGSTAYLTSLLLRSTGCKVGFHMSPFISDIRERFQINNALISKNKFIFYFNDILPIVKKVERTPFGRPTYFEIVTVLMFYIFYKEKVDYAVVETGLGGWHDATNAISNSAKISVITKIGHDHTKVLGKTLDKIALQKIMITQPRSTVISLWQHAKAQVVIERIVKKKHAKLYSIRKKINFTTISTSQSATYFDFRFMNVSMKHIKLSLLGSYQVENCSLALATYLLLADRDSFQVNEKKMRSVLENAQFPARFEILDFKDKKIIVDGAHNPQKMQAFISNLAKIFPNQKFHFFIAFKKGKDYRAMLKSIISHAVGISVTGFYYEKEDLIHVSNPPEEVGQYIRSRGVEEVTVNGDPHDALRTVLKSHSKIVVITGSIYFIGSIYTELRSRLVEGLNIV